MRAPGYLRRCTRVCLPLAGLLLFALVGPSGCTKGRSITDMIYFDLLAHPFRAVREFRSHLPGADTWYEEELSCLGDGVEFQVSLRKVRGKPRTAFSGQELQDFDRFQARLRQGEGYRVLHQRDFRVEDLALAMRNYQIFPDRSGSGASFAPKGEASLSFWVLPNVPDRSSFHITVSTEDGREGFPLSYREYIDVLGTPTLAYEMRVLDLDYGNPSLGPSSQPPTISRRASSLAEAALVTYPLYVPSVLPSGYRLLYVEEVVQSTDAGVALHPRQVTMQRMVFSDGINRVDLIQHEPLVGVAGTGGKRPAGSNPLVILPVRQGPLSIGQALTPTSEFVIESRLTGTDFEALLVGLRRIN